MKVEIALADYRKQVGAYPTTALGLDALVKKPNGIQGWHGPYTSSEALLDPHYGHRYAYESDGRVFKLIFLGADGKKGGTGWDADLSLAELNQ